MKGRVISVKTKNTATVLIERVAMHPLYKKTFLRSKKYLVEDLLGVKMGDIVELVEIKPMSKNKFFKVAKVVGRSFTEIAEEHMKEKAAAAIEEVMPASPDGGQGGPEEKESKQATGDSEQEDKKTEEIKIEQKVKEKRAKKESK